ncbi:DUF2027 domain-containing protein [Arcicella aquatica]|uniref:DUF2027 domain-containing protein n=1 Tax=Arcicella aquatica TaxID=217141 RepID=A0ABU5QJ51_9BACT|nr:DUF2027 domain-containing protein [Arcicella aquatica]MEA5256859.1 DUF2027 domain-containing protein [Arcicella aquatica]
MNIGDKVRLLRGKEEGIVTKILSNNIIEIEIEDGFTIPVKRSDAVIIDELEQKTFKPVAPSRSFEPQASIERRQPTTPEILANKGVYMAFVPVNDRELSQHLINNTDWELPFMLSVGSDPHHKGLASGTLKPKSSIKVQNVLVKDFEEWGTFVFQAFFYRLAFMKLPEPLIRRLKFRVNTFFKSKQKAPILNQDAHLFQLDAEDSVNPVPTKINTEKLIEQMFEKQTPEPVVVLPNKPALEVDLHIEKLSADAWAMSNREMLALQLATFDKQFEAAIANGMDEITFIHGVGNGVLRDAIHKKLSGHKNVKYFEDAQKEKFGYGATNVKIK